MYNQSAAADKNGRSELCQTTHATYPLWYPVGEKAREVLPLGHFFVISFLVVCAVTTLCLTNTRLGKLCSVPRFSATFREEAYEIHSTSVGGPKTCPPFVSDISREWDLGPHVSAQDAIQRFAPFEGDISGEVTGCFLLLGCIPYFTISSAAIYHNGLFSGYMICPV